MKNIEWQIRSQVWCQVEGWVHQACDRGQIEDQVWTKVKNRVWVRVDSQVEEQIRGSIWRHVNSQNRIES